MTGIETSAADLTPDALRAGLLHHGCVLMRGAVPPKVLQPLQRYVGEMFDHFDRIPKGVLKFGRDGEAPERRSVWSELIDDGVHYDYDVIVASSGHCSLYDGLYKTPLLDIAGKAFPGAQLQRSHASCVRRMTGDKAQALAYSDAALDPHIDAMVHQRNVLSVNFWTPLSEAGVNQPGLAVVPIGIDETLAYLEYSDEGYAEPNPLNIDGPHLRYFRLAKLEPKAIEAAGFSFWRPAMQPGDVLAFTNFTIHATSTRPGMTGARTSIEARLIVGDTELTGQGVKMLFGKAGHV